MTTILSCLLISYRDEKLNLNKIQDENYNPLYSLLKENFGLQVKPYLTLYDEHSNEAKLKLSNYLDHMDTDSLVILELAASLLKSTSLALLMLNQSIQPEETLYYSRIEEIFQIKEYGHIEENHSFVEKGIENQLIALKLIWTLNVN